MIRVVPGAPEIRLAALAALADHGPTIARHADAGRRQCPGAGLPAFEEVHNRDPDMAERRNRLPSKTSLKGAGGSFEPYAIHRRAMSSPPMNMRFQVGLTRISLKQTWG